jgi:hypothetical protein
MQGLSGGLTHIDEFDIFSKFLAKLDFRVNSGKSRKTWCSQYKHKDDEPFLCAPNVLCLGKCQIIFETASKL